MQKSGGIRAGFQGLEGMVVPVKIKALADLRSSDYRWIAGIAGISISTSVANAEALAKTNIAESVAILFIT